LMDYRLGPVLLRALQTLAWSLATVPDPMTCVSNNWSPLSTNLLDQNHVYPPRTE
jgi:hypothetical protein